MMEPGLPNSMCCLPLIRGRYPSLAPAERKVAVFIMSNPAQVTEMTSLELSQASKVSESTVVKCCQHLGFAGFSQLKMQLVRELATSEESAFGEVEPGDDPATIRDKVFTMTVQALQDTAKLLDPAELSKAANAIRAAKRVVFFGVGSSGVVAQDAQLKFMRVGITSIAYLDTHLQLTQAALLAPDDVAVVITYSGRTREALDVLNLVSASRASAICVTNFPASPAAHIADIVLCTAAHEATGLRSGATTSRITQLALLDCLFMAVVIGNPDEAMTSLLKTRDAVASRKT